MEDSAYESIMLAVYIFIFILATTLTIFLFSTTVSFADKAYEYGKAATGQSVIETTNAPEYNTISGAELITYYYNYQSNDKYGTGPAQKYKFQDIGAIDVNKTYTLIYKSVGNDGIPVIQVKEVQSEEPTGGEGPIVVEKAPNISGISITNYSYGGKVLPGTLLEFSAQAFVTYSPITNSIRSYTWTIDYSPDDSRPNYTYTQYAKYGELTKAIAGDNLKLYKGTNTISVYAEDVLGNKSIVRSITVDVGYNDPIINSVKEKNSLVNDGGNVDINSPGGASLDIVTSASSKNLGGTISRYDYYVNNILVQSTSSNTLSKVFAPGAYNIKVIAVDSISGTAERSFTFTVNQIHAPTITCSNTDVTTYNSIAIVTDTINLTFTASLEPQYSISKYVWNIDGTTYETSATNGITLNYAIGSHTISVYGVTASGLVSQTRTFNFTVKEDYVPFEQEYTYNGGYYPVTLPAGKYVFETWGAQGGNGSGGYGGYSKGQLNITTSRTFYVYVGSSSGYNGGGSSRLSYSTGGGATDIRITSGTWNNVTSLRSRIMVAAGGGGNGGNNVLVSSGGSGGGLSGYTGGDNYGDPGTGGTQTSGGTAGRLNYYGATNGSFGIGGNGESVSAGISGTIGSGTAGSSAGAGGGGYYGGGGGSCDFPNYNDLDDSGGGGGSSFISGYTGCNAVSIYGVATGQPNHYSGLVFINSSMTSGNNSGNGKAKITRVR